jgi:hypothetical protein
MTNFTEIPNPLAYYLAFTSFNKGCITLVAWPFTLKKYLKAKQELQKLKYFTMQKYNIYNLQKKSYKRNPNPSRYYNNSVITNLKFQHKPKISTFKNPHIKNK